MTDDLATMVTFLAGTGLGLLVGAVMDTIAYRAGVRAGTRDALNSIYGKRDKP